MINCTVNNNVNFGQLVNVKLLNSTFNDGISFSATYKWRDPVNNITIKNCKISGKTVFRNAIDILIEECIFDDGYVDLLVENLIFNKNYVNAPSSTYAIHLSGSDTKESEFTNISLMSIFGQKLITYLKTILQHKQI